MKIIDLNIKTDDLFKDGEEKKTGIELSKDHIDITFTLYQRQPDARGQPRGASIKEQRKIYKILDDLESMKKGMLELEDDRYEFLKEVFNEVSWVGGTKVIVRIADKIDEAGIEKDLKDNSNKKNTNPAK